VSFRGLKPLLDWRQQAVGTRDYKILNETLTVEGLPYDATPPMYEPYVRRYRKLRTVDRLIVCRNYIWWLDNVSPRRRVK
jgi:hypothetical protein